MSKNQIDDLELIADPKLAKLLGFSLRSFARWDNDPSTGFPAPIKINGRNHRRRAEVDAWLKARALGSMKAGATKGGGVTKGRGVAA